MAGFEVRVWGFAMWGLLAWLVLLAATVVLASVAFHFDVAQLPAAFQALSPTQQVAAILIASGGAGADRLDALAILAPHAPGAGSPRGAGRHCWVRKRARVLAAASQKDFDAAVAHLTDQRSGGCAVHRSQAVGGVRSAVGVAARAQRSRRHEGTAGGRSPPPAGAARADRRSRRKAPRHRAGVRGAEGSPAPARPFARQDRDRRQQQQLHRCAEGVRPEDRAASGADIRRCKTPLRY